MWLWTSGACRGQWTRRMRQRPRQTPRNGPGYAARICGASRQKEMPQRQTGARLDRRALDVPILKGKAMEDSTTSQTTTLPPAYVSLFDGTTKTAPVER